MARALVDQCRDPEAPSGDTLAVAAAAGIITAHVGMQGDYQEAMGAALAGRRHADKKTDKEMKGTLLSQESLGVLAFIWEESKFFTDEALAAVGKDRRFSTERPLTCWGMAKMLAGNDLQKFDSVRQLIRRVVDAAVEFGLVERTATKKNLHPLAATTRLHELMMQLAGANLQKVKFIFTNDGDGS